MSSLIQDEYILKFQESSLQYLSSYIMEFDAEKIMILKSFKLTHQSFVYGRKLRHYRRLKSNGVLKAAVKITVIANMLDKAYLVGFLGTAMQSQGYDDVIKSCLGIEAGILSSSSKPGLNETNVKAAETISFPVAYIVATTSTLVCIAVLTVSIVIHQRRRKRLRLLFHFSPNSQEFRIDHDSVLPTHKEQILRSENPMQSKYNLRVDEFDLHKSAKSSREDLVETKLPQPSLIPPMIVMTDIDDEVTNTSSNMVVSPKVDEAVNTESGISDIVRVSSMECSSNLTAPYSNVGSGESMQAFLSFQHT